MVALIGLVAGCKDEHTFDDDECNPDGSCPDGYVCIVSDNRCVEDTAGPIVTITAPEDDARTGSDGEITYEADPDTARVECTLDAAAVACELSSYTFSLADGTHAFTIQGFDTDDHPGPIDSVTWTVDAGGPIVDALAVVDNGGGQATASFTLHDGAGGQITSIHCRLDGVDPFTACGTGTSGSVDYALTPGPHVVEVYGVDDLGNTGLAAQSSTTLPASFARADFGMTTGPGHLVLIGNDYADRPGDPDAVQATLLANAVRQSAATSFTREIQVLGLRAEASSEDATERDNVRAILAAAFDVSLSFYTEVSQYADVAAGLQHADVLLIYDHNGQADVPAAAALLEATFATFLQAGGVIVVLDGLAAASTSPSRTFEILSDELLDIDDAVPLDALIDQHRCASNSRSSWVVPCNEADPLLAQLPIEICDGNLLGYVSDEPWVTYASLAFEDEPAPDVVGVFHKWFGAVDPAVGGPIAVTLVPNADLFPDDEVAVFQDPDPGHSLEVVCSEFYSPARPDGVPGPRVLKNGSAVHHMIAGMSAHVSRGYRGYDDDYDFYGNILVDWAAPAPLDDLRHTPDPPTGFPAIEGIDPTAHVVFPADADVDLRYSVQTGCSTDRRTFGLFPATLEVKTCRPDGYSVVVDALDAITGEIVAYVILNGQTEVAGGDIVLPDFSTWSAPNVNATLSLGTLTDSGAIAVDAAVTESIGALHYFEGQQIFRAPGDLEVACYRDAGAGTPSLDRIASFVSVEYDSCDTVVGPRCYQPRVERVIRSDVSATPLVTTDLSTISWLPTLHMIDAPVLDGAEVSVQVVADATLPATIHGGVITLGDQYSERKVTVVFPYEGAAAFTQMPPPPGAGLDPDLVDCESYQLACDFWMFSSVDDTLIVRSFELVDSTAITSYDDLRREWIHPTFMRAPSPGVYTRRTTRLVSVDAF